MYKHVVILLLVGDYTCVNGFAQLLSSHIGDYSGAYKC